MCLLKKINPNNFIILKGKKAPMLAQSYTN